MSASNETRNEEVVEEPENAPLNEEEDDESSVYEEDDEPPTRKRRSFTNEQKLKIVEYADREGLHKAERRYAIDRKTMRVWQKKAIALNAHRFKAQTCKIRI